MKCTHEGCERKATHVPKLFIPVTGYPAVPERSLAMLTTIELCRDHAREFEPAQILDCPAPKGGGTFAEVALPAIVRLAGSNIPPDPARAWCVALAIDTDEYQAFKAASDRKLH